MAILETKLKPLFVDKEKIRRIAAEQNAKSGFVPDPTATPQRARARMLAQGVRPEDCIGSIDIIEARDE